MDENLYNYYRGAFAMLSYIRKEAEDLEVYFKEDLDKDLLSYCQETWELARAITEGVKE